MRADRRRALALGIGAALAAGGRLRAAGDGERRAVAALDGWFRLILELVRHTPTYSPPVASRAFACLGIAAYEAAVGATPALVSLAGQVGALPTPPAPPAGLDAAAALHGALAASVDALFANTGPTGRRAIAAMTRRLGAAAAEGLPPAAAAAAEAHGRAVAAHVLAWAETDGGARVENMGFPLEPWPAPADPGRWVPTSLIAQQQAPLLPGWGRNRPFALPDPTACPVAPPQPYDEAPDSAFMAEAAEVHAVSRALTDEQKAIARFWADDPMLSPTPPGHWIAIALAACDAAGADLVRRVEALALTGIALADAFIVCWRDKYRYDLVRPETVIRRLIEPGWRPFQTTPPFPEHPSGHSVQSAAAAEVLTALFGEDFAFEDRTHEDDGLPPRRFASFRAAAAEAGIARLYGGMHFRTGIEAGLAQGRCVGAHAAALRTRA